jgi:hypothetical protein
MPPKIDIHASVKLATQELRLGGGEVCRGRRVGGRVKRGQNSDEKKANQFHRIPPDFAVPNPLTGDIAGNSADN